MIISNWQRIKTIIGHALELNDDERVKFLKSACGDDTALRSEVEALLAQTDITGFMETPVFPAELEEGSVWIGKQLGPYRITRELPAGGMGRVFQAERSDGQYHNTVAIKILRASIDTPEGRQRFAAERQIVAALKHPYIAHLIDGGVIDGLPYFVMEFIDGLPIDVYCSQKKLGLAARLQLFVDVCSGVEFAHQQLIVHRDLKPENILITAEGLPKLLDFGVAKFLVEDAAQELTTTATIAGGIGPFTPGYAAPEQFCGGNVSTATDVYALGCVLYRLLTGNLPFAGLEDNRLGMMQVVCEQDPRRPSIALLDQLVNTDRAKTIRSGLPSIPSLAMRLRGDLDVIVLKALAKDPDTRYHNVTELRLDIARHLAGYPIRARPPSVRYAAAKFIQRHRIAMLMASVALAAVIAGMAGVIWQGHVATVMRIKAETRLQQAQELAQKIIFDYNDSIADLPGALPVSRKLMADASEFLDKLNEEETDHPALLGNLAAAYQRLADVQGGIRGENLGEIDEARKNRKKAYDLYKRLLALQPKNPFWKTKFADLLVIVSDDEQRVSHFEVAHTHLAEAVALTEQSITVQPNDLHARFVLGNALYRQSMLLLQHDKQYDRAAKLARQAQHAASYLLKNAPEDFLARYLLANALTAEGLCVEAMQPASETADELFNQAIQERKKLLAAQPEHIQQTRQLAEDMARTGGRALHRKEFDRAKATLEEAKQTIQPALLNAPQDLSLHYADAVLSGLLTDIFLNAGDIEKARLYLAELTAIAGRLLSVDASSNNYLRLAAMADIQAGVLGLLQHDKQRSRAALEKGFARAGALTSKDGSMMREFANSKFIYSELLLSRGLPEDAIMVLDYALPVDPAQEKNDSAAGDILTREHLLLGRAYKAWAEGKRTEGRMAAIQNSKKHYRLANERLEASVRNLGYVTKEQIAWLEEARKLSK